MQSPAYPPPHARRAVPWVPIAIAVSVVCATVLILALVLIARDTFDPAARTAAINAAAHAAAINQAVQPVDVITAALWRLIPPALVIAAAGVGLAILWRRYGWRESIAAGYTVRAVQASNPPLPKSLHTFHQHPARPLPAYLPSAPALLRAAEDDEPEAVTIEPPTFAGLLDSGTIGRTPEGRPQPLILGYHQGEAITGDWRSLYSSGLGGLQGSGKTWTAAYLLTQSALAGARLVICDPHAGDAEGLAARVAPLAPSFLCDVAEDEHQILNALKLAADELHRRKTGHPDRTPVIVAVDEWSGLRRGELADLLPQFIEDFSTEGRKLNCHVMLMGQRWDKSSVGDFRNTLASSYIHRMRADEARMMTGLRAADLPADTLRLAPGVAYLLDTRGQLARVHIPHTTSTDIARAGAMLAAASATPAPTQATGQDDKPARPMGFQNLKPTSPINRPETENKPAPETGETAPGRGESETATDPETVRILALFYDQGKSIGEIVKEVWPEAKSGTPYNERRAQVEATLRKSRPLARAA